MAAPEKLTLAEISRRTDINYRTLLRYLKLHLPSIPHQGQGHARRFPPEAIPVFQELKSRTRGGRRPGKKAPTRGLLSHGRAEDTGLARRLDSLARSQEDLAAELRGLRRRLRSRHQVTFSWLDQG